VLALHTQVMDEERRARVAISRPLSEDLRGVGLAWAEGEELGEIARRTRLAEGDLVGLLQKTIDILNQLRAAVERAEVPARRSDRVDAQSLLPRLAEADAALRRGVVEASYRWALSGPPDVSGADADWTVPTLQDEDAIRPGRRPHHRGRGAPRWRPGPPRGRRPRG
jgi:DSHCT (NUC185) domain